MTELLGGGSAPFLVMTLVLFGGAAFLTGQALAQNWRPAWQILPTAVLLAAADRFLHYALFGAELTPLADFAVTVAIFASIAAPAYYLTRARKMVQQYPWLYVRRGPFSWRRK
jgi:hypothetical protein